MTARTPYGNRRTLHTQYRPRREGMWVVIALLAGFVVLAVLGYVAHGALMDAAEGFLPAGQTVWGA